MSVLEPELYLQPASPEHPSGPDLQYDADFIALETAAQGKPEQQYGDTIIPAEPPEWKEMKQLALGLLSRSKDLRVACHLARAMVELDGLAAFGECLTLIRGYVGQYWDTVHPQLDPDDDNDPTERVNVVSSLSDRLTTVAQVMRAPLVRSNILGVFSMHDVQQARGEAPTVGGDPPPDIAAIEAAFLDCDLDHLKATCQAAAQAYDDVVAIDSTITDLVGAANAASLEQLSAALKTIRDYLQGQLNRREGVEAAGGEAGLEATAEGGPSAGAAAGGGPPAVAGQIASREDVIRTIDKICEYYDRQEPSSPVPLLLRRAKRLVTKSFMDILEDLTPDGVSQARQIGGVDSDGGNE